MLGTAGKNLYKPLNLNANGTNRCKTKKVYEWNNKAVYFLLELCTVLGEKLNYCFLCHRHHFTGFKLNPPPCLALLFKENKWRKVSLKNKCILNYPSLECTCKCCVFSFLKETFSFKKFSFPSNPYSATLKYAPYGFLCQKVM